MARVMYAIKIVLFRSQFEMTKQEKSGIKCFAQYAVLFYVRYWFAAPIGPIAPRSDLEYLERLEIYDDTEISMEATKVLSRHLWYLSEELGHSHSLMMMLI